MLQSGRLYKMDGQALLLLLLLVSTVVVTLHANSGTTVSPKNSTFSFKTLNLTRQEIKDLAYQYFTRQCWDLFAEQMANISTIYWCEWRTIRRPYSHLRKCLESEADKLELDYPNSMAEEYIIISHHNYFHNCTLKNRPLQDPPENILLALIITPICLIPFLVALVVLKSKDDCLYGQALTIPDVDFLSVFKLKYPAPQMSDMQKLLKQKNRSASG